MQIDNERTEQPAPAIPSPHSCFFYLLSQAGCNKYHEASGHASIYPIMAPIFKIASTCASLCVVLVIAISLQQRSSKSRKKTEGCGDAGVALLFPGRNPACESPPLPCFRSRCLRERILSFSNRGFSEESELAGALCPGLNT